MDASPHFRDLLLAFNEANADYLIVGGYAFMKYAEPRFTKDLDLWVSPTADNAAKVFAALKRFGAPLAMDGVTAATFAEPSVVYQIGVAPIRCDITNHIDGVEFGQAWPRRVPGWPAFRSSGLSFPGAHRANGIWPRRRRIDSIH